MATQHLGPQAYSLLTSDELLSVPWLLIPKGDFGLVIVPNLLNTCSALLLFDHVPVTFALQSPAPFLFNLTLQFTLTATVSYSSPALHFPTHPFNV